MKKILLIIITFCLLASPAWATTYTAIAAGGNWSSNTTWGGSGHPVAGDTAIINSTMLATVTVDVASACEVLNLTGNGGTLAFGTQILTVGASGTGAVTLGGTTSGTTGGIKITGASTLTGNSLTFNGSVNFGVAGIVKLSGSWITAGLTTFSAATNLNYNSTVAETYTASGGITTTIQGTAPTALVIFAGGTFTSSSYIAAPIVWYSPLTINPTAGNITFTSGHVLAYRSTTALTYLHSTYTVTTTGFILDPFNTTLATDDGTGHIVWDNCYFQNISASAVPLLSTTSLWCNNLYIANGSPVAQYFQLAAGSTLTVNTSINAHAATYPTAYTIKSSSTSPAYFNYLGTLANENISGFAFSYINASGSSVPIWNYAGGTLTGTTNITNVNASNVNSSTVCTGANNPGY